MREGRERGEKGGGSEGKRDRRTERQTDRETGKETDKQRQRETETERVCLETITFQEKGQPKRNRTVARRLAPPTLARPDRPTTYRNQPGEC